jgi:hypothetical protein
MLGDLDDIIDAAVTRGSKPCLVEVGRALHQHETTTAYAWSSGRITATVGTDWVRLKRRLGVIGDAVRLDVAELRALDVACGDWTYRRDGWAAYYTYPAAPPPYGGSVYCYLPPGRASEPLRVGREMMGRLSGERFRGSEEIVPLQEPVELTEGVRIQTEIWRRGERHGPADGSLVGVRYRLSDVVTFDAERRSAKIARGGEYVYLEPGEENFVAAVLGVVGHDGGQTGRPR